jgi:hypothetical protein
MVDRPMPIVNDCIHGGLWNRFPRPKMFLDRHRETRTMVHHQLEFRHSHRNREHGRLIPQKASEQQRAARRGPPALSHCALLTRPCPSFHCRDGACPELAEGAGILISPVAGNQSSTIEIRNAPSPHSRTAPAILARSQRPTTSGQRRPLSKHIDVHRYTPTLERPHQPNCHPQPGRNSNPPLRREPIRRRPPVPKGLPREPRVLRGERC